MKRPLAMKIGAIALLILFLLVPLHMIREVVQERQHLRNNVVHDIARSSSYSQKITGPVLVVPYRKTVREMKPHPTTHVQYAEMRVVEGKLYLLPETFALDGHITTEVRARGIYQARLYHASNQISGEFIVPPNFGIEEDLEDYTFEQPYIALGISDIRGISNAPKLRLNDLTLDFKPGTRSTLLGEGVRADLPLELSDEPVKLQYGLDLKLQGSSSLNVVPVGRDSQVKLGSDWPHPSFFGEYLPVERDISDKGFGARWQASFFSTNLQEALDKCAHQSQCEEFNGRSFGVGLVDPVDHYLKSERAVKYALLFLVLTFAGFFLFEVLKRLALHPIQYGLVGMALALFYLLLLSLSEHMAFGAAYAISAGACVLLIGFYVSHVLHSLLRGIGFGVGLAALYGMLYQLLRAEDHALLMGSVLLFALLGGVMVLTRKLDWYRVGRTEAVV